MTFASEDDLETRHLESGLKTLQVKESLALEARREAERAFLKAHRERALAWQHLGCWQQDGPGPLYKHCTIHYPTPGGPDRCLRCGEEGLNGDGDLGDCKALRGERL